MHAVSLASSRSSGSPSNQVCLARQPILDSQCNVVAYELLFRHLGEDVANVTDASRATLSVINNTLTNFGLAAVLGGKKAFINFDAKTLEDDVFGFLSPDIVVLEILETIEVHRHLLERIQALNNKGYRIALDDFVYQQGVEPLLALADIVKIDVTALSGERLAQHAALIKKNNKQLLAEKVETHQQFETCKALGCDLYQGFFFAQPTKLVQADIPASTLRILNIMNNIMADADDEFLERSISHDISLSYKLLKFVNSAGLSCGRELRTVKQALSMLGRNQLYRWLSLILFTSTEEGLNQSNALLNAALYRGRLLELFAEYTSKENPNELFILGTFSYLEALLNREMRVIVKDMLLPATIKQALLEQDGKYWPFLQLALTMERGETGAVAAAANEFGMTLDDLTRAQLEAINYSETAV